MTSWWITTLPPIPGAVRAVFYGGLLVLCLIDHPSPLDAPKLVARTAPEFYTPVAVLRILGLEHVRPPVLTIVRWATIVCWVAAAAGFGQPVAGLLTFVGFAFLHAVNAGALGANHSTHAALFALLSLSFCVSHDTLSLDTYLADRFGWSLLLGQDSVLASGFAALLLMVFVAYIMFAGGVAKLRYGGRAWLSGRSLRFYITQSLAFARAPRIAGAVAGSAALCRILAWLTVAIELAAPLILLLPGQRNIFVLAWICLHIGILLVMMPAYWVQMWCYMLLMSWAALPGVLLHSDSYVAAPGLGAHVLAAVGTAICVVLLIALLRQSEQWPFTSVPMYSNGLVPEQFDLPRPEQLTERARLAARGELCSWHRPWVPAESLDDIEIVPADSGPAISLFDAVSAHDTPFVRWSQFAKVVREVAIDDLSAKPPDRPDDDAPGYPGNRFLTGVLPFVRQSLPDWQRYSHLQLACLTTTGWFPIATADLADARRSTTTSDAKGRETP
ncbi:hypothetical protein [Nocardia gamkensis]|uniref:HTTM domain-containing protein n=1 Tax=Nocardia gamkensis TaxID=352869 RepID=A0A7X6LB19_9NOCA|nr:hypothetical protein [Nocardia gamkensis]NKY31214.1 hypothetical protein [Nocardia gamkensis]NQE71946.1 hypothetical protein [Nocardia gamkensis]